MADKIRWAVSVTPIEELEDAVGNTYDVIHSSVGKTLGASGSITVVTPSFNEGREVTTTPSVLSLAGGTDSVDMIYIENYPSSAAAVFLSTDGGTTYPIIVEAGEASLLHLSGVTQNNVLVKTTYSTATIKHLMDKP